MLLLLTFFCFAKKQKDDQEKQLGDLLHAMIGGEKEGDTPKKKSHGKHKHVALEEFEEDEEPLTRSEKKAQAHAFQKMRKFKKKKQEKEIATKIFDKILSKKGLTAKAVKQAALAGRKATMMKKRVVRKR